MYNIVYTLSCSSFVLFCVGAMLYSMIDMMMDGWMNGWMDEHNITLFANPFACGLVIAGACSSCVTETSRPCVRLNARRETNELTWHLALGT
jgi:hypothetical protein